MFQKLGLSFIWILISVHCLAQKQSEDLIISIVESKMEVLNENDLEGFDNELLYDNLKYFYNHPLNINQATQDELIQLLLLSPFQVRHIIQHRNLYGDILELEELQLIQGFDEENIASLKSFIHFGVNNRLSNNNQIDQSTRHLLSLRSRRLVEKSVGFTENGDNRYQGDRKSVV